MVTNGKSAVTLGSWAFVVLAAMLATAGCKKEPPKAGPAGDEQTGADPAARLNEFGRELVEALRSGTPDKMLGLMLTKDYMVEVLKVSDLGMGRERKEKFEARLDWMFEHLPDAVAKLFAQVKADGEAAGINWNDAKFVAAFGLPESVPPPVINQTVWTLFESNGRLFAVKSNDSLSLHGGRVHLKEVRGPGHGQNVDGTYFIIGPHTAKGIRLKTVTCEPPSSGYRGCSIDAEEQPGGGDLGQMDAEWKAVNKDGVVVEHGEMTKPMKVPTDGRYVIIGF